MNSKENKSEKILKDIGWRISEVRLNMGLTQEEFADKFGYARATLAKLESGHRDIKSTEIVELAEKLGVSCDYLLGRTMASAPDNTVQEMVDRYGLWENTLKILLRLKDSRKNKEDFLYMNLPPNEDYEDFITAPNIIDHIEHDERILEMINLLFTTERKIDNRSCETYGEYIFYKLYEYLFKDGDNNVKRAVDMAMIHEDIVNFGKTLEGKKK